MLHLAHIQSCLITEIMGETLWTRTKRAINISTLNNENGGYPNRHIYVKNITMCQHVDYSQVGNLKKALKSRKLLLSGVFSN